MGICDNIWASVITFGHLFKAPPIISNIYLFCD